MSQKKKIEDVKLDKIYSYSKIQKFKKCPLNYYFYYLDPKWKGYKEPKDYNTKGSAVHDAITLFYYLPKEKRNFKNLRDFLYKAWFSEKEPEKTPPLGKIGGFEDINHERKVYSEALMVLKNFYEIGDIAPSIFYLPTENIKYSFSDYSDLVQPINDNDFISGKFDRIDKLEDGTLRIIDYKTSKNHNNKFQLDFYRILAELNFNIPVTKVSFYYLDRKEIADFPSSDTPKKEIKQKILEDILRIKETQNYEPRPSALCGHCDFKKICPIFK